MCSLFTQISFIYLSYIIWNYIDTVCKSFLKKTRNFIEHKKPTLLGLLETKCSGNQADVICNWLGFDYWVRVEALSYNVGIWVLWKDSISIDILKMLPQFLYL